jgi:hypothetical protein
MWRMWGRRIRGRDRYCGRGSQNMAVSVRPGRDGRSGMGTHYIALECG